VSAPGLRAAERAEVRRVRRLPLPGQVLVAPGDRVGAETVIAAALLAGRVLTVPLAGLLGCTPAEAAARVAVAAGQGVRAGDLLARAPGIFGLGTREARAPAAGTVEAVSGFSGQLTLRLPGERVEIAAHLPGRVTAVLPGEGAEVACTGAHLQGVYGVGGEVRGPLCPEPRPGGVLALPAADGALLRWAAAEGVRAVVTGGVPYLDLLASAGEHPALVVVLTEGFGPLRMRPEAWAILSARWGRLACADGTTQIRAGVIRPELVIPAGDGEGAPAVPRPPVLRPGARVRLVAQPYFGRTGLVLQLPLAPQAVPGGAVVRVALLALDGAGTALVPQANVEVLG